MSHLLLIIEPPGQRAERTQAQGEAAYAEMLAFADRLRAKGQLVQAQALAGAQTRVKRQAGQVSVLDGPFADTKELFGGFFWLQNVTREQALALAAECPAAAYATIEVRELGPCFT